MYFLLWVFGSVVLVVFCVVLIFGFEVFVFVVDVFGVLNMDYLFLQVGLCLVIFLIFEGVVLLDVVCLRDDKGWLGLGILMNIIYKGIVFEKLDYLVV